MDAAALEEAIKKAKQSVNKNEADQSPTDKEDCKNEVDPGEKVYFKVVFNKNRFDVSFGLDKTIADLKGHLEDIIQAPPATMKVMVKGLAKDTNTLRSSGIVKGSKVMVIASKLDDILKVSQTPAEAAKIAKEEAEAEAKAATALSREKMHKKVLEKGKPDDALPGRKSAKEPLPSVPLTGMINKYNSKVRLTFKNDMGQLWIGTKERTQKIAYNSIKNVTSQPVEDHEEYHMVAFQLGPTEASRYWVYWVPAQYVEAIKDTILGTFQDFYDKYLGN